MISAQKKSATQTNSQLQSSTKPASQPLIVPSAEQLNKSLNKVVIPLAKQTNQLQNNLTLPPSPPAQLRSDNLLPTAQQPSVPDREMSFNVNKYQKNASLFDKVMKFEIENNMTITEKRKTIHAAREYKQKREGIIRKHIEKERQIKNLIPCLKPGCTKFFRDNLTLSKHIEAAHKVFSDQIGNRLHECSLCGASYVKEAWLEKHIPSCYQKQKEILKAQGKYPNDAEDLNTDEELEYQAAQKYN